MKKRKTAYKNIPLRLLADFPAQILQATREWRKYIQSAERKKKKFQLGILLSGKVIIKN